MFNPGLRQTPKALSTHDRRMAWMVALAADAIQIVALPLFAEGGFSPFDTAIDLVAGVWLCRLLGWHWAFLPAVMAEMIPGLDLFPTWTAAVFYVTKDRPHQAEPEENVIDVVPIEPPKQ